MGKEQLRNLPSVDRLLNAPELQAVIASEGPALATEAARAVLAAARAAVLAGAPVPAHEELASAAASRASELLQPSLQPVINATGVIIHTNLGRAPLSAEARAAMDAVAAGYSNLEYDLAAGSRGSRYTHTVGLLSRLTGAESALVVNNNAGGVLLALSALAAGREAIISRGQLVEIGGGFRVPEVMAASGARLVEVGTTNRTYLEDYRQAITADSAALVQVHTSNFRVVGFTHQPERGEMAALAHEHGLLLIDDLGSGSLFATEPFGIGAEPDVPVAVAAGADLVLFSGDKLLGGPQAGIIVGRAELIERLARHPLTRALRVDKSTLAALQATLLSYARGRATEEIPIWRMIAAPLDELARRAQRWADALARAGIAAAVEPALSTVGGGSLPGESFPTRVLELQPDAVTAVAAALRAGRPPVVARIEEDRLLLDPRTVLPEQDDLVIAALLAAVAGR